MNHEDGGYYGYGYGYGYSYGYGYPSPRIVVPPPRPILPSPPKPIENTAATPTRSARCGVPAPSPKLVIQPTKKAAEKRALRSPYMSFR